MTIISLVEPVEKAISHAFYHALLNVIHIIHCLFQYVIESLHIHDGSELILPHNGYSCIYCEPVQIKPTVYLSLP